MLRRDAFTVEDTDKFCVFSQRQPVYGGAGLKMGRRTTRCAPKHVFAKMHCPYVQDILDECLLRRPPPQALRVGRQAEADIVFADYESVEWDAVLAGQRAASCFSVRKGLSRKAQLSRYVSKWVQKQAMRRGQRRERGEGAGEDGGVWLETHVPETVVLETWEAFDDTMTFNLTGDIVSFGPESGVQVSLEQRLQWCLEPVRELLERDAADSADRRWILKPSVANKGAEICIVREYADVLAHVSQWSDMREWVLQRYIERPLLHLGKKFHLRAYILAVGTLRVLFFDTVLLLTAAYAYRSAEQDDDQLFSHLTNTAHSALAEAFDERQNVFLMHHVFPPDRAKHVLHSMHMLTNELFQAFFGEFSVFLPMAHCFELYGLDFMVDEDDKVWLLEVNPGPDVRQTGNHLRAVIGRLYESICSIVLDDAEEIDTRSWTVVHDSQWPEASSAPTMQLFPGT